MIPRLGDGNCAAFVAVVSAVDGLENDSPSRGRKHFQKLRVLLLLQV